MANFRQARLSKICGDPYFCHAKASGKHAYGNIFARPYACNLRTPKVHSSLWGTPAQTTVLGENALPKVALLSLANQTSQILLLVFLDDCHSLLFASSATGSAHKRPPIQIRMRIWRWAQFLVRGQQNKKDTPVSVLFALLVNCAIKVSNLKDV